MAATNTYLDNQGERRWRQNAICPASKGKKTCGQHLADHQALVGVVTALPKKRRRDFLGRTRMPHGCSGHLYPGAAPQFEPPECQAFRCEGCGGYKPWSCGCGDEHIELCDDCWYKRYGKKKAS